MDAAASAFDVEQCSHSRFPSRRAVAKICKIAWRRGRGRALLRGVTPPRHGVSGTTFHFPPSSVQLRSLSRGDAMVRSTRTILEYTMHIYAIYVSCAKRQRPDGVRVNASGQWSASLGGANTTENPLYRTWKQWFRDLLVSFPLPLSSSLFLCRLSPRLVSLLPRFSRLAFPQALSLSKVRFLPHIHTGIILSTLRDVYTEGPIHESKFSFGYGQFFDWPNLSWCNRGSSETLVPVEFRRCVNYELFGQANNWFAYPRKDSDRFERTVFSVYSRVLRRGFLFNARTFHFVVFFSSCVFHAKPELRRSLSWTTRRLGRAIFNAHHELREIGKACSCHLRLSHKWLDTHWCASVN